jgi:hypothetical protein
LYCIGLYCDIHWSFFTIYHSWFNSLHHSHLSLLPPLLELFQWISFFHFHTSVYIIFIIFTLTYPFLISYTCYWCQSLHRTCFSFWISTLLRRMTTPVPCSFSTHQESSQTPGVELTAVPAAWSVPLQCSSPEHEPPPCRCLCGERQWLLQLQSALWSMQLSLSVSDNVMQALGILSKALLSSYFSWGKTASSSRSYHLPRCSASTGPVSMVSRIKDSNLWDWAEIILFFLKLFLPGIWSHQH